MGQSVWLFGGAGIVFGVQNSEPVLMALLNALLGYTGSQKIVSLTIVNPTLDKEYLQGKGALLSDVLELPYIELRKFSGAEDLNFLQR